MLIGGLQKTSLLDYPGKVSAIVFTVGCNFRCGFCYNANLVTHIDKKNFISAEILFDFLKKRKKVLDAVVITGGEPTLHLDLPEFIKKIKELGYLIKLDTNGTNPKMIASLIKNKLIDYLAMDIKGPLPKYSAVVNSEVNSQKIKKSITLIMNSGLPYEFRSTILPALHTTDDLIAMAKSISGADKYFLQKFKGGLDHNDPRFATEKSFKDKEMKELAGFCRPFVKSCEVR
jgi:pyruvate formate lyase activating enzyme